MKKFVLALFLAVALVLPFSVVTAFAEVLGDVTINYASDCVYESVPVSFSTNDTGYSYPYEQNSFTAYVNGAGVGDFDNITWLEQGAALPAPTAAIPFGAIVPVTAGNTISVYVNDKPFGYGYVKTALTYPTLNEAATYVAVDGGVNVTLTDAILNEGEALVVTYGTEYSKTYAVPFAVDGDVVDNGDSTYTVFVAGDFVGKDVVINFAVTDLCEEDSHEFVPAVASVTVNIAEIIDITADPDAVDFGSAIENYTAIAEQKVTITNNGNTEQTLTLSDDNFQFVVVIDIFGDGTPIDIDEEAWRDGVAFSLEPGASEVVAVRPVTGLVPDSYEAVLIHNDAEYCELAFKVIAAYTEIEADQDAVDFGSATVDYGEIDPIDVTFTNSGNINGTVSFVGDDAFDLLVEGVVWNGTVSAGGSVTVSISPKEGLSVDEYELVLGDYCTITFVVTAVQYADITADRDAVDFGSATVTYGAIDVIDVTFTNSGNIDGTVSFVGDDAFDLLVEGVVWNGTVSAGGSVTVSISPKTNLAVGIYTLDLDEYCTITFEVTAVPLVGYTIAFDLDGGTWDLGDNYSIDVPDNRVPYTINVTAPTKVDFKFAGWMLGEEVVSGFDANYYPDGGIVTLVADWDPIVSEPSAPEFDVEATGNTGEIKIVITTAAEANDSGLTLQRYEYRLLDENGKGLGNGLSAWFQIPLASANSYIVTDLTDAKIYTVEVRARFTGAYYEPATESQTVVPYSFYTIVFNLNGGMWGNEDGYSIAVKDNRVAYDLDVDSPEKAGYTFIGWLLDDEVVISIGVGNVGDVTLVASWSEIYKISWYFDGGAVTGDPASSYTYGTVIEFPTVTKSGYTIKGWNVDGELITASTCELNMTGNITIEAVFTKTGTVDEIVDPKENLTLNKTQTDVAKVGNYGILDIIYNDVTLVNPNGLGVTVTTSNAAIVKVYVDEATGYWMYQSLKSGVAILKLYYNNDLVMSWTVTVKA